MHRKTVVLAAALLSLATIAVFGQPAIGQGRIVGTVRDSASGRPLIGALVAAQLMHGRVQTDSHGRFALDQVTPGVQELELNCPSRTALGRRLLVKRMRVLAGDSVVMALSIDMSLCDEPPYREITGDFRGHYSAGFEHSAFSVCADTRLGIAPVATAADDIDGWSEVIAWVSFTPQGLADWRRLQTTAAADSVRLVESRGFGWQYVRWHGTLRGPGTYGHFGGSAYEMLVDTILYLGSGDRTVCQHPPDGRR